MKEKKVKNERMKGKVKQSMIEEENEGRNGRKMKN